MRLGLGLHAPNNDGNIVGTYCNGISISISLSIYPSIYLSTYLSIYLSIYPRINFTSRHGDQKMMSNVHNEYFPSEVMFLSLKIGKTWWKIDDVMIHVMCTTDCAFFGEVPTLEINQYFFDDFWF